MANYKPKSLDELNSFYDKSLASQNVIKNTASAINTETFESICSDPSADISAETEETSPVAPYPDLTEDINNFIKNFGKPATKEDEEYIIHTIPVKNPKPVRNTTLQEEMKKFSSNATEKVKSEAPVKKSDTATKSEKAEFVMTAERSELFNEYMRIMSDEDEESDSSKSKGRKRKKNKKAEYEEFETDDRSVISVSEPSPNESETEDSSSDFFADKNESSSLPEIIPSYEEFYNETEQDEEEPVKKRNHPILQILFVFLILITLLSALIATLCSSVLKINSGELVKDKYYFFSSSSDDITVGICSSDLLVAENEEISSGDVFAFIDSEDNLSYAVKIFGESNEFTNGENAQGSVRIRNSAIKGKITTVYPSIGAPASFFAENFTVVIFAHAIILLLLIVAAVFVSKSPSKVKSPKDNFSFDESEEDEDDIKL